MRAPATSLTALLVVAILLAAGQAGATVERAVVRDSSGARLAVVTWDDEKAIRQGQTRGFLVLVERLNASVNLTVFFEVVEVDPRAFRVVSLPMLEPLGEEPASLHFRLHANDSAEPRRYPLTLALTVVNLNATSNATVLTRHELAMNLTVSPHPTPFGETGSTLSRGEWTVLGSAAAVLAAGVLVAGVRRARRGRARHD